MRNLRDLGGIAVSGGARVRGGVLLRADAPEPGDRPTHVPWPPRTVVDLRSSGEKGDHPLVAAGAAVHAVPLSRHMSVAAMAGDDALLADGLTGLYRRGLRGSGPALAAIVALVAQAEPPVLVHCAAGKDRTGIVVATLLAALGASRQDIVADYTRTRANMPAVIERLTADGRPGSGTMRELLRRHPDAVDAPPGAIEAVLDELDVAGGAQSWLLGHGLQPAVLELLTSRFSEGGGRGRQPRDGAPA